MGRLLCVTARHLASHSGSNIAAPVAFRSISSRGYFSHGLQNGSTTPTVPFHKFNFRGFASGPRTVKVPTMGDSITEGTINEWKKQPGDYVGVDEVVAIIDTDKVSLDINAPASGTVVAHLAKPGDTVLVGADLFTMEEGGEKPADTPAEKTTEQPAPSKADKPADKPQEKKPEPAAAKKPEAPKSAPAAPKSSGPQVVLDPAARTEEHVPLNRIRKRVAERLKHAQNTAASLTTFNECDMSGLMAMRSELNEEFLKASGGKFGFVSAFLYASARALKRMPQMNAYISEGGDEIIYKNYVDISVAVATPTGLLVPVIRDCERKSIPDLEADLVAIAQKAREGKIALEEMAGGSFTISNGGVFGSLFGTPILNPPQSSILGLHAINDKPVVRDGEIVIRPIMYLALTYDHRLVDGREAVTFLNQIKNGIEDPRRLLLNL